MSDKKREAKSPEERAKALEEALKRVRPKIMDEAASKGSVQDRLGKIALQKTDENTQAKDDKKKDKKKPMSMEELAKRNNKFDEKVADAEKKGISVKKKTNDGDEKNKNNEKDKDKNKEMTPEKQEQKMKEMFSKVNLPSGMEIRQEGPSWMLVSKDGKQRTDVTDVMNTIDKYNRNVDAANKENSMQNNAQAGVDKASDVNKKDNGLQISDSSDKVQTVQQALPNVKDVNGNQVFKPEDIKTVAETALNYSNEKAILEDPNTLKQLRDREKSNERKAEDKQRVTQQQYSMDRGGR